MIWAFGQDTLDLIGTFPGLGFVAFATRVLARGPCAGLVRISGWEDLVRAFFSVDLYARKARKFTFCINLVEMGITSPTI